MNISVIIPALNEQAHLERAVRSAWAIEPREVVVADGGSRDQTRQVAQQLGCQVLQTAAGRAGQQNAGAAAADGAVLLFLHADTWLSPEAGGQLRAALEDRRVLGGAFRQRIDSPAIVYRWLEWGNARRVQWLGWAYGDQGLFMRAEVFHELGGFPAVGLMEDLLLMKQFRRRRRWPVLLPGPIHVSPRRWERAGVVRQTLRNWSLVAALHLGVSPDHLASYYVRHDRP